MNIDKFQLLNDYEKEEIVWASGIYLATYDEDSMMCDIYQLPGFYVMFCYELNTNKNAGIRAHNNPNKLLLLMRVSEPG